ncbi:hypothetical protein H0H93_014659, partial [Arthromyces matolae]
MLPGRGILDIELGDMIESISKEKGGLSIVAMLDCCRAGSGTRAGDTRVGDLAIRGINLGGYAISADAIPQSSLRDTFFRYDRSHILLAACAPDENAHEDQGHGLFTRAFLDIVRKNDIRELTYSSLISLMDNYEFNGGQQTPRCEGYDLDRVLFTQEVRPRRPVYKILAINDGFRLEAGIQDGIKTGAQFTVHTDKHCTPESLVACVEAQATQVTFTHCSYLSGLDSETTPSVLTALPLYALQTHHGQSFRLFIDREDPHYGKWSALINNNLDDISVRSIRLVELNQEADLGMSTDGEE